MIMIQWVFFLDLSFFFSLKMAGSCPMRQIKEEKESMELDKECEEEEVSNDLGIED